MVQMLSHLKAKRPMAGLASENVEACKTDVMDTGSKNRAAWLWERGAELGLLLESTLSVIRD
jgi:hypothetical protein